MSVGSSQLIVEFKSLRSSTLELNVRQIIKELKESSEDLSSFVRGFYSMLANVKTGNNLEARDAFKAEQYPDRVEVWKIKVTMEKDRLVAVIRNEVSGN